jgi:ribose transport system substrate-binding protein
MDVSEPGVNGPYGGLSPRMRTILGLVLCAMLIAVVAGCGSSSSSSSTTGGEATESGSNEEEATTSSGEEESAGGGVAEAEAAVQEGSAEPKFEAPGPAFKVDKDVSGQTIWYVANGLNFPFSENLVAGTKEAAAKVGMKVNAVDGAGQPAKAASLIQQGISQNVAAIVIQAFPTEALEASIKEAKTAGIPVIQINDGEELSPTAKSAGVVANVTSCYSCGGEALAALVSVNTENDAHVVFIDVPEIKTTVLEREAFEKRLGELCSECSISKASSPVAQWGNLASLTGSLLKQDPETNYLVPALDAMIPLMKPAIFAGGAAEKVQVSAYNATQPNMEDLQKGELVGGLVGNPEVWMGWAVVDETLRSLSGQPTAEDENIPNRTFTEENVAELDLKEPPITWYGEPEFRQGYEKLWEK